MDLRKIVTDNPLLAVLRGVAPEKAEPLVRAVMAGGVRFFEVALNSAHAMEEIAHLRATFDGQALIGAGTATTVELAQAAVRAGAQFLLSPSTDRNVLAYCEKNHIPLLPGALTPTDISTCLRYGFSTIKLFPADAMPKGYIKSLKSPFDGTEYVAMGGVNASNIAAFFREGYLGVGLGGSLLPTGALQNNDWAACTAHVAAMVGSIGSAKAGKQD